MSTTNDLLAAIEAAERRIRLADCYRIRIQRGSNPQHGFPQNWHVYLHYTPANTAGLHLGYSADIVSFLGEVDEAMVSAAQRREKEENE